MAGKNKNPVSGDWNLFSVRSLSHFPPKKPGFYDKNGGVTEIL
jgi:hypothetical protein